MLALVGGRVESLWRDPAQTPEEMERAPTRQLLNKLLLTNILDGSSCRTGQVGQMLLSCCKWPVRLLKDQSCKPGALRRSSERLQVVEGVLT